MECRFNFLSYFIARYLPWLTAYRNFDGQNHLLPSVANDPRLLALGFDNVVQARRLHKLISKEFASFHLYKLIYVFFEVRLVTSFDTPQDTLDLPQ